MTPPLLLREASNLLAAQPIQPKHVVLFVELVRPGPSFGAEPQRDVVRIPAPHLLPRLLARFLLLRRRWLRDRRLIFPGRRRCAEDGRRSRLVGIESHANEGEQHQQAKDAPHDVFEARSCRSATGKKYPAS